MSLDDGDLRWLAAEFEAVRESTALLLKPVAEDVVELKLQVIGDGNGHRGLVRIVDALAINVGTHHHPRMVSVNRKVVATVVSVVAGIAGVVSAVIQAWPHG